MLSGQTTFATLTGTVSDATGAYMPGITITALHQQTNTTVSTKSNEGGAYTMPQLKEGFYVVRATGSGFKEFVAEGIQLQARDYRRLDIRLEVGELVQRVEVTADAMLVETETPRLSDTRTAEQLVKLPLNTNSMGQFRVLTPGATQLAGTSQVTAFGSRQNQAWMTVDGTTNDGDGNLGQNLEWMQELKQDLAVSGAEFGTLVNVTVITKSGTNQVHGSFFEYYRSPFMGARNPFAASRGGSVYHELGGSFSGPLYLPKVYDGRNRTFFFLSPWLDRAGAPKANLLATVPLESWRRGEFGVPIRNPLTSEVYMDGRIPASQINPVAKKIQERFYPLPNFGNPNVLSPGNFRQTIRVGPFQPTRFLISRLDHRFGDRDSVFARYTWNNQRNVGNNWDGDLPTMGPQSQDRRARHVALSHIHTFGPTLINEVRYGHRFGNMPAQGFLNGPEMIQFLGIQGLAPNLPDIAGVYNVAFSGLGLSGITQQAWTSPAFLNKIHQFQDQVSYFRGTHNVKAGVDIRSHIFKTLAADNALFGAATFANTFTSVPGAAGSGNAYADFLLGIPTSVRRAFPPELTDLYRWNYDFFVQDDWKVSSRLTLNLGLRYEYHPNDQPRDGRMALFDAARGAIVVADQGMSRISPLMPKGYVDVISASAAGLPADTLLFTDRNNLAPRVGFAYRPLQNNRTVLRGGYGIYYDYILPRRTSGSTAPPFTVAEPGYTNTQPTPSLVLPQAFPSTGSRGPSTVTLPAAINPHIVVPYSQQFSVTIERQQWDMAYRMSYVGTLGRKLLYRWNINTPAPDERMFVDKPRPFPTYPGITATDNGANHNYHGLTLEVERRMKNGLFFQFAETWANDIGDATASETIENPFDRRRDRASEQSVPTHRATLMSIYQLPVGRGRKWFSQAPRTVDMVAGGWEISVIGIFQTGQRLTPLVSIPDPTGTAYTTSRNRPLVSIRPDQLRNPQIDNPTISRWFDTSAFAAPPLGRYGNSARSVILGPGVNIWHAGLAKEFRFTDNSSGPRLRLELTATNVLNHPNWSNPALNLSAVATAATITGASGPNNHANVGDQSGVRNARAGLRLEW